MLIMEEHDVSMHLHPDHEPHVQLLDYFKINLPL